MSETPRPNEYDPEHDPTIMGEDRPRHDGHAASPPNEYDPDNDPTIMGEDRPRHDRHAASRNDAAASADPGAARHGRTSDDNSMADHLGEAAGGISGAVTGAALGSIGGPVGTVIGGIAGAVGGWWAGRAIVDAALRFEVADDQYYSARHKHSPTGETRKYEDVRPAYQLGHLASLNPDYAGRKFEEIEPDLRGGWHGEASDRAGDWTSARDYARDAYADANARRGSGPDSEQPIVAARGDAVDGGTLEHVELNEGSDPGALGDGTSVTGYAGGLTDRATGENGPATGR